MTREIMGNESPVMNIIQNRYPGYIGKDGFVRAQPFLGRGIDLTTDDLAALGLPGQKPGRYAPIYKHGHELILRKPADIYAY